MGKSTAYVLGYGIRIDNIKGVTVEGMAKLLHNAPKYEKEIYFDMLHNHIWDTMQTTSTLYLKIEEVLQRVIKETEGLELTIAYDYEDDETFLVYPPSYPWKHDAIKENIDEEYAYISSNRKM